MSELRFNGKITEIREPRVGNTEKGDWANVEFEVTELKPQNELYPQVGLFDYFKNGEHVKYAKDFKNQYKVGDEVTVEFNLKKNTYTNKDGKLVGFYKTSAWRIEKLQTANNEQSVAPPSAFEPVTDLKDGDHDDLLF